MNQKRILILVSVLLVIVLAGAGILYSLLGDAFAPDPLLTESSQEDSTADPSDFPAPDFTVYDREGNPHKLSDFEGKPTVLNFWASWCGLCKSEMPAFEAMYQQYGEEVHFLLVNLTDGSQETVDSASAYIDSTGYTFPVYYDTDLDAAGTYGVSAVPQTYFIDADGNLIAQARGALNQDGLTQGIGMITNIKGTLS